MKTNVIHRNSGYHAPILLTLLVGLMCGLPAPNAAWSATNWRYTGSMASRRWGHTATLLPNSKVLVAGGIGDSSGTKLASAELYDPDTGAWTPTGSMIHPRCSHTATLLFNGKVLVTGGHIQSGTTSSAELYDPNTGVWTATGSLNTPRVCCIAALITSGPLSGSVLVAGGYVNSSDGVILASAELYNPSTGTWSFTGSMTIARYFENPSPATLPDGSVLVVGGTTCCPYHWYNEAESYDPQTQIWTATGGKSTTANSRLVLLPNDNVLVAGGTSGDQPTCVVVETADLYSSATRTWAPAASMSTGRDTHTLTLLGDGEVLAAGGISGGWGVCQLSSSAELYDASSDTWSLTGSLNAARRFHTATLLPNGQVLVAGGVDCSGNPFSSAELYVQGIPLPVALNATNLVWTWGGNAGWVGQTNVTHDGAAAAQSGTVTDGQESWLQTTVTGPGVVAFWWKVSSEGDCDFLEFYVGGALQTRISGEVDWQWVGFAVPAGSQTLRWRYVKDVGTDLGGDAGSVDEVVFAPNSARPVILLQPASQVVVTGATVNLRVSAAGSATLRYQWFRESTNAISGATSATLVLANVQLTNMGNYSVVVTNLQGTATSSSALLTVTTNGPVNNILLFFDSPLASPYQNALSNQARAYRLFGPDDELAFNQAIAAADPGGTLVVVDSAWRSHNFDSVRSFVQAGGRAILQYVYLGGSSAGVDFKVTVAETLSTPQSVYDWGGTTLFAGLSSPLSFVKGFFLDDGQKLQPTAGGQAVAGYTSGASANQAAVVIGNSRRTLVNGFILEEASPSANGVRLAQNEIDFLASAAQPTPPFFTLQPRSQTVVVGAKATFSPLVSGTAPFSYQWLKNGANLPGITSATYSLTNVQPERIGNYQVVVTNLNGAVTSRVAALTLTMLYPVESVLLYCDGAASNPYQSALQALGRPMQLFTMNQEQGFSLAIRDAHPGKTLAIMDWANQSPQPSGLDTFANAGGRAILSIWYLTNAVSLPPAFGATVVQTYTTPMPVYNWGGSPFFTGIGSPLSLAESGFNVDGQRLQPTANGKAVAGYTSVAAANQAALVIGNSGRTILNGFFLENANSAAAVQLAKNEIQSLLDLKILELPVPQLPGSAITTTGGVPAFKFTPPAGLKYRMVWKNELTDTAWTPLGDWSSTSTGAEMTLTDTTAGGQAHRFYRLEAANP